MQEDGRRESAAAEQTPLLSGGERVRREFEDALHEEAPDATLYSVLVKRPGAVIVALSLFALLVLASTSVSGLTSPEFVNKAAEVPQLVPQSAELLHISSSEIAAAATVDVQMDYSVLGSGLTASWLQRAAAKLAFITVKFDDPVEIRAHRAQSDAWEHVASTRILGPLNVSIVPDARFVLTLETRVFDVGRPQVVGMLVRRALHNQPVTVRAEGTVVASKWGLEWRMPFCVVKTVTLPQQTTDELADLSRVHVATAARGVNVTALANATLGEFPVSGTVPAMGWTVKIPGCDAGRLEVLCDGFNPPVRIEQGDETFEAWFSSLITRIPAHLTQPCDAGSENSKSPIDTWISQYLAGQLSTFYIEGSGKSDDEILNQLFTGFDIPVSVFGKPASEKLISSVTIEDAAFQGQGSFAPNDDMQFSGKALVGVTLPKFLEIDKATVIMVDGVKGTIQLFTSGGDHFAQVLASDWLQTITLASKSGYKITCYFDRIPMRVTNTQAFARVSQEMVLTGSAPVRYDAVVDVQMDTPVGDFAVKKVRVKGATEMRT